jgi:hypothetical protein
MTSIKNQTRKDVLKITEYAKEKLHTYAQIADDYECMGLLLGYDDNTVRDIFLLKGQEICHASVEVDGHSINESMFEFEERFYGYDYQILGWTHSHGCMEVFHSSTDDRNTRKIFLEQLAPGRIFEEVSSADLIIKSAKNGYTLTTGDGSFITLTTDVHLPPGKYKAEKHFPVYTGSIFSLVTNRRGDLYAESWKKQFCKGCDSVTIINEKIDVQILKSKNTKIINREILKKEFEQKTCKNRWGNNQYWSRDEKKDNNYQDRDDYYKTDRYSLVKINNDETRDMNEKSSHISQDSLFIDTDDGRTQIVKTYSSKAAADIPCGKIGGHNSNRDREEKERHGNDHDPDHSKKNDI